MAGFDLHKYLAGTIKKQEEVPDGYIRISGPIEHDTIVNGDGLRAIVWTQGCPNHCEGCQNPETWDYEAGKLVKVEDICKELAELPGQTGWDPWEFLKSLDALIDGPFILKQRDLSLRIRGSKNQRLLKLKYGTGDIISIE